MRWNCHTMKLTYDQHGIRSTWHTITLTYDDEMDVWWHWRTKKLTYDDRTIKLTYDELDVQLNWLTMMNLTYHDIVLRWNELRMKLHMMTLMYDEIDVWCHWSMMKLAYDIIDVWWNWRRMTLTYEEIDVRWYWCTMRLTFDVSALFASFPLHVQTYTSCIARLGCAYCIFLHWW